MAQRVIVIGSLNYDVFLSVKRLPKIGETFPAKSMESAGGGKGANQAVQCAKLGLETAMVGAVGNDPMGSYLLGELSRFGVGTDFIRRQEGGTGFSAAHMLEGGQVSAIIAAGANAGVTPQDVDHVAPLMKDALAVVLQLEIPIPTVEYAIRAAKAQGTTVLLNAAPASPVSEEALKGCDVFMANEVEASFYTGQIIETVEDATRAIVPFAKKYGFRAVFTLGDKGAVAFDGDMPVHIPAVPTRAVESTGAGDSFVGGYLKGQAGGLSFAQSLRFAAHCSAVTISKVGGQEAMPTLAQVEAFLTK